MNNLVLAAQRFLLDEEGVAAVEYGLLAMIIALGIAVAGVKLSSGLTSVMTRIGVCLAGTATCA